MNKTDLIDILASSADISKAAASRSLEAMLDAITESLAKSDPVVIIGFGTFDVKERKARTGRNPKTGEPIAIPAARIPRFKPGKSLKEKVNK